MRFLDFLLQILLSDGFSKFIKYIFKNYNEISTLYTFADLRWSDKTNNVYTKAGFSLKYCTAPDYFYIKEKNRFHRSTFMKFKLKKKFPEFYSDNLTEKEIMKKAGYKIIYDCGNALFILNRKN